MKKLSTNTIDVNPFSIIYYITLYKYTAESELLFSFTPTID